MAVGPPWISSTHGYFFPDSALVGSITQYWTLTPSGRVIQCSVGIESDFCASHDVLRSVSRRSAPPLSITCNSFGFSTLICEKTTLPPPSPNAETPADAFVRAVALPPASGARSSGSPPCQFDANNTLPSLAS